MKEVNPFGLQAITNALKFLLQTSLSVFNFSQLIENKRLMAF
jgi:hypothetical protein